MSTNFQYLISVFFLNLFFLPIWFFVRRRKLKANRNQNKKKSITREILLLLFVFYILSVCAVTIVPLPFSKAGAPYLNLDFFHQTYYNYLSAINHINGRTLWSETENLIGNVILFFPLGFLLPLLFVWYRYFIKVFIIAFLFSFLIEAIQYYISINWGYNRLADIDDLALNVLGATLGYLVFKVYFFVYKKINPNNKRKPVISL